MSYEYTDKNHIGRKMNRIRELHKTKPGVSQQSISNLENSETIKEEKLPEIAKALGITAEGIKNFIEETILNIIGNTYHIDNSSAVNYSCTFPL